MIFTLNPPSVLLYDPPAPFLLPPNSCCRGIKRLIVMDRLRKPAASHWDVLGDGEVEKMKGWMKASRSFFSGPCFFLNEVWGRGMLNGWQWYLGLLVYGTQTTSLTPKSCLMWPCVLGGPLGQRASFFLGETWGILILNVTLCETHTQAHTATCHIASCS